ncbi:5-formyltetrahydrofolate cyclo-ligase [Myroides pelagicus]|uniref:5-formyltetrahydrofolate cyclo-ligase n=1 Tax=Myroides pelagicus TaxID=270914 RepID=A0A7K1GL10_9FLAO|nr:5-formyltetrahydrofolate cyclo-ligase [Myroides pelagicus]MEC4112916.1 5-formyltetrahydrofolate cyclo-ligase [Myroides pelagicus]MTH28914.1 5-formyltetrahydrofolate cyclo-ligase [Myroides pelagicus]
MDKASLRKKYKTLRDQLSEEAIDNFSLDIANQALQLPIWEKTNYHLFLTIANKKEIDTEYLLQVLAGKDKNIIISKSDFESGELTHYLLTDNTRLKLNNYGIPEPIDGIQIQESQLEVVFVPLLAYDRKGNRIGYGKGFYDRFLAKCKPETIKVGLSFFCPETEITDIYEGDFPLDYCITPSKVYTF